MGINKSGKSWQRTDIRKCLRNRPNRTYYAFAGINGKQKWRRHQTETGRFILAWRERTESDLSLAPATKLRREIAIKALFKTWPGLARRDVRQINASDCQKWAVMAFRKGTGFVAPHAKTPRIGMSPSAFNKCVDALRAIFAIAREEGAIERNPAALVQKVRVHRRRMQLPSSTEFQAVVRQVTTAGARWSRDCADMVRLLAFSGARLREATALRWRHVDEITNRMTIPGTKSESSYRVIPIFPPLAELLSEMRARRGDESADAPLARVRECRGSLRSACRAIGIAAMTHHDLRHLFATRCIESGVDVPTVSRWLGHSDGGVLAMETYSHLRDEHSIAQAAKVHF